MPETPPDASTTAPLNARATVDAAGSRRDRSWAAGLVTVAGLATLLVRRRGAQGAAAGGAS